jgi:hypothetical protein
MKNLVYYLQAEDVDEDFELMLEALSAFAFNPENPELSNPDAQDLLRRIKEGAIWVDFKESDQ